MVDFETQQKVLHSPFDLETHKKTFIDYLEIIISISGKILYAIPSHTAMLEMYLLILKGIDFNEYDFHDKASDLCPFYRYYDYNEWLCEKTGCIMVWGCGKIVGNPNENQKQVLEMLRKEGLLDEIHKN